MIIYFSLRGGVSAGGPTVFAYKAAKEFVRRGHKVIYEHPERADWALAIIETGKLRRQLKGTKTKILLRTDGIYNEKYNTKFNRAIRPDMVALHTKLKSDVPAVDWVVYQSSWSKDRIDDEIAKRDKNWSIINNGVDLQLFTPTRKEKNECLNLLHTGSMRNGYLMKMLIEAYKEIKRRGIKCKLLLVGTMDSECLMEFNKNHDEGIFRLGSFPNNKLKESYGKGDIFLDVRQGASCNNVVSEAQACGLPVIVSSWGGSVDLIKDGLTGKIVESGQWDYDEKYVLGIADAAQEILKDLEGFKQRARQHAEQELSIEKMIDKYLDAMKV